MNTDVPQDVLIAAQEIGLQSKQLYQVSLVLVLDCSDQKLTQIQTVSKWFKSIQTQPLLSFPITKAQLAEVLECLETLYKKSSSWPIKCQSTQDVWSLLAEKYRNFYEKTHAYEAQIEALKTQLSSLMSLLKEKVYYLLLYYITQILISKGNCYRSKKYEKPIAKL